MGSLEVSGVWGVACVFYYEFFILYGVILIKLSFPFLVYSCFSTLSLNYPILSYPILVCCLFRIYLLKLRGGITIISTSTNQNLIEFHSEILELVKPRNMLEIIRKIGATSIHHINLLSPL